MLAGATLNSRDYSGAIFACGKNRAIQGSALRLHSSQPPAAPNALRAPYYRLSVMIKTILLMKILQNLPSKLLIIGDSCEPLWETINEELYDGNSIDNIIETLDDINLITSEMILSKRVNKLSEWEELEKVVFLFYFKDLSQYFIPCTFEYRFNENCFQEEKPVEILEVKKTFDGVIGKNKIKSCSVIIEKYLNDRYKCSKFVFDIDNNEISSGDALYYQDKRMKSIIEDALSLDFSSLTSFFKYSKGSGNVYSISYKRADFSFSYSLWINDNREFAPKFFVDFIESIFAAADEEPKHCIKFGEIKLIGVPLIKT